MVRGNINKIATALVDFKLPTYFGELIQTMDQIRKNIVTASLATGRCVQICLFVRKKFLYFFLAWHLGHDKDSCFPKFCLMPFQILAKILHSSQYLKV